MNNPKISIIIPIYNIERYLTQCLESIATQSYENLEIIAVNDGSPDNSATIIEQFAERDSRIKHIKKQNEGVGAARQSGIDASTGEYIMFVDGDDFIPQNSIEIMVSEAVEESADMVFSDFFSYYNERKNFTDTIAFNNKQQLSGEDYIVQSSGLHIWGRIIKREHCLNCDVQTLNMGEDIFAMIQIIMRCKKICYIKIPLYYYRQSETSLMHSPHTVSNEIEHKIALMEYLVSKNYPKRVIKTLIVGNIPIVAKYCNDFENQLTANKRERIKILTRMSLKLYPSMFREQIKGERARSVIVFYLIHYIPSFASTVCKYNKMRGKKNYEL